MYETKTRVCGFNNTGRFETVVEYYRTGKLVDLNQPPKSLYPKRLSADVNQNLKTQFS